MFRTILITAIAAGLGLAAAFIVACGKSNSKLIPSANAELINGNLEQVRSAVASGDCSRAAKALANANSQFVVIPATVDPRLRQDIASGLELLDKQVKSECPKTSTPVPNEQTTPETTSPLTTPHTETTTSPTTSTTPTTPKQPTNTQKTTTKKKQQKTVTQPTTTTPTTTQPTTPTPTTPTPAPPGPSGSLPPADAPPPPAASEGASPSP